MTAALLSFITQVLGIGAGVGAGAAVNKFAPPSWMRSDRPIANLLRKWTGTGLTEAQVMQNQFNADQAQIQRDYEERLSNTANQRAVVDMQNAGLNPALMYGSGSAASTPSGSAASAASVDNGMSFGELVNALALPMQLQQMKANIANTMADADLKRANTENVGLDNTFLRRSLDARVKGLELSNNLTSEEIERVNASRKDIEQGIKLKIEQTANEVEKRDLIYWDARLKEANANQIVQLLPYQQLLLEAQTENQKATALCQFYNAAYKARLIDAGYIETQIETMRTQARAALISANAAASQAATASRLADANIGLIDANKAITEFKNSVFHGDVFDTSGPAWQSIPAKALNGVFNTASMIATSIGGPLSGLLGAIK